jgi:L-cysteine:1D-myo-inositol 2-amino-2-deoxy-alpha-D-glucopyranoside ligase
VKTGRTEGLCSSTTRARAAFALEPGPIVTSTAVASRPTTRRTSATPSSTWPLTCLQRRLRDLGHETRCVRNVTDVDDDILRKARELGVNYLDLAAEEMAKLRARHEADQPAARSTPSRGRPSAIPEILTLIGRTFDAGGLRGRRIGLLRGVEVPALRTGEPPESRRDARVRRRARGRPDDPNKRDPLDFVLWQPSLEDEPAWESRWGPGRPGWHIECSALALRELGVTLDVHGGGRDLTFPHHECECAQSESVTGAPFVKHWMHVGWWVSTAPRCPSRWATSSSSTNWWLVPRAAAVRLALLDHHYREDWEWRDELAPSRLSRVWRRGARR